MKKKLILVLLIVILSTLLLSGCGKTKTVTAQPEKIINVETQKIEKQNFTLKTTLTGKIEPIQEASISPKVPGKIEKVNVEIGDYVKQGDILFKLEQEDSQLHVDQAQASYELALANLKKTQEQTNNAVENYNRMKALYEQKVISKQQFETAELNASATNLDIVKAQVKQSEIALQTANKAFADAIVTSPISGFVTFVNVNKGEFASNTAPAVTIANINPVQIKTSVSEYLINKFHKGDSVDVLIKSARSTPFKGKISALSPAPAKNTMTYPMKVTIDNNDSIVKPGMFAEISIISDKRENVLSVPSQSVVIKDGNPTIFVIKNNKAQIKYVTLGLDNGEMVEIKSGLQAGEIIVIKGQNYLENGDNIKVVK